MSNTVAGKPTEDIPGAILLDGFLQSFFLGIILTQALKYWDDYRDDSWRKRLFVALAVLLSILQTVLEDYKVWRTIVLHKRWSTSPMHWSDLFLNGCICCLCESFYIRRCWKMVNKSPWVLFPLSILLATLMAANTYLTIAMSIAFNTLRDTTSDTNDTLKSSQYLLPSTVVAFSYWIFGSLTLDATVTLILLVSLWRSKIGQVEADQIVLRVITITWESAALPSIAMLVAVALYHAVPLSKDHLILFFVLMTGKLYTIGMLRTLNSRVNLRQRMKSHDLGRISLTGWQWDQGSNNGTRPSGPLFELPNSPDASVTLRSSVHSTSRLTTTEGIAPNDISGRYPSVTTRLDDMPRNVSSYLDVRERGTSRARSNQIQ